MCKNMLGKYLCATILFMSIFSNSLCELYETKLPKCCDSGSVVISTNFTFNCTTNIESRIEIATENISETNGNCIDQLNSELIIFDVKEGELFKKESIHLEMIPKCCPSKYYYNITTRSCNPTNTTHPFFENRFLKIGLRECKIIYDEVISNFDQSTPTDGDLKHLRKQYNEYCIDRNHENNIKILRICTDDYNICNSKTCILKCCPDGQSFVNGSNCKDTFQYGINLKNLQKSSISQDDNFAIVHGMRKPIYKPRDSAEFNLDKDGIFGMSEEISSKTGVKKWNTYKPQDGAYCIEYFQKNAMKGWSFFRPLPKKLHISEKFYYTRYTLILSSVCLVLTIIYYCLSLQKNTLFGKTLLSYCFSTLILFIFLTQTNLVMTIGNNYCTVIGFIIYYASVASFTWLNIMCFDIYWTFGSSKTFSTFQNKRKEWKRFLIYSSYGWGLPITLTAVLLIFYHFPVLPDSIAVNIGDGKCYFQNTNYSKYLFYVLPVTIQEIINTVLFTKTILYCFKVKAEISKMNDTHALKNEKTKRFNKYKERLGLLLKLFLIMGIALVFEIVSTVYDFEYYTATKYLEIVWDIFNSLQGVFIFLIFVLKIRVIKQFQKTLPAKFRRISYASTQLTQSTSITHNSEKKVIAKE